MKPRRWVLVLFVLALLLGVSGTWGLRFVERKLGLEHVVVKRIEPLIGGSFDVDEVGFGFFSVYFKGVTASLPLKSFEVKIEDIKVGFSLRRLVATRGDFSRSIAKIIFVRPEVTVHLDTRQPAPGASGDSTDVPLALADIELPIDELQVRRGAIRVIGSGGEEYVFGEFLNGRIVDKPASIEFELHGRLASLRRNLALTGEVAKDDSPNHLSLLLDNARISKAVRLPFGTITAGRADGLCEFTFGGRPHRLLESTGWIRITDGVASLPALSRPLKSLDLSLTLDGNVWGLDSLRASYSGMHLKANGAWDLRGVQPSRLSIEGTRIDVERLFPDMPPLIRDNLYGEGRMMVSLERPDSTQPPRASFSSVGFSVLGKPLTRLSGGATVLPGSLRLDSIRAETMAADLFVSGDVALGDSFPAYRVSYDFQLDSLPTVPWLEGAMRARGTAYGRNGLPLVDLTLDLHNPRVADIDLGSQSLRLYGNRRRLILETVNPGGQPIVVSASVDTPLSSAPRLEGTVEIGRDPIRSFLAKVTPLPDSVRGVYSLRAELSGLLPQWEATAELSLKAPLFTGKATMTAVREDDDEQCVRWKLSSNHLLAGGAPFPLHAQGRLFDDSLLVDSSSILERAHINGRIGLTKPDNVDLTISFDSVSLAQVNTWLFSGDLPVDSGVLIGDTRISGFRRNLVSNSEFSLRHVALGDLRPLDADAIVSSTGRTVTVLPMVLRKGGTVVISLDTVVLGDRFRVGGEFESIDIATFLGPALLEDIDVDGRVHGSFASSDSGFPVNLSMRSDLVHVGEMAVDSVLVEGTMERKGMRLSRIQARDGRRSRLSASAWLPWAFLGAEVAETDTMSGDLRIAGDILGTLEHGMHFIVGGTGDGTISASFQATQEGFAFTALNASIPSGQLTAGPYIPSGVSEFSLSIEMDDSSRVTTVMNGYIGKRPAHVYSTHRIPRGYRSFEFGPLDFGILLVETPKGGVALHMPGFHEDEELVEVEFGALKPFPAFALSGPLDHLRITGVWALHSCEFTYPLLKVDSDDELEFDPFPYIDWELDITAGNRNVVYYRDLSGRKRKLIRFFEAYVDPTTRLKLRGRAEDGTFRLLGQLRSYKGNVYFGKVFDRRFEMGLDFAPGPLPRGGYNNYPIIWGSAETFSDTSRLERIKLTLHITDPVTGGVSERGRAALIPRPAGERRQRGQSAETDSILNFVFHLSSDFEQIAGASERKFFQEAGLRFTTLEGAGEFVSSMGEAYLHRYLLQRFEKRLAKRLGLDVISFETSIASNYFSKFYKREFSEITDQWNMLALAHVGVTIGRYFFRDNLFIKARGELVPIEELLVPEYSIGFEFTPVRYLFLDFNYGIHRGETSIEHDPRLNLQLRFPLTRLRKHLKF